MRLKYKILWVENDSDWVESIEEEIKELVEQQYGFDYDRTFLSKQNDAIMFNDYDLILMDLNLESEPTGDVLIKNIRDREIYTDVIFYSADGLQKIKQKAHDLDLEGVCFASRNKDLFVNKVNSIIKTTIHKVQDLNNLRGLVMAEVSELDVLMSDILNEYYVLSASEEKTQLFHKHITKSQEQRIKDLLENCNGKSKMCCHVWKSLSIDKIIPDLESYSMAKAVNYVIPSDLYKPRKANFLEDYNADIISIRNQLAHCKSENIDGKEVLKTQKGDAKFSDEDFKRIRLNIRKYSDLFKQMLGSTK